jgi:glycosyltransferase involved in cell wall biosynthesis
MVGKNPNLVSVVVNCHNSERFIEECIASITKQSYQNFEIIIWDNKSDDATASIVHELSTNDARIKYFRGESFVPLGAARNLAMQKCSGSWIAFLDSDDIWDHNYLSDQMEVLAGKEKTSFGFGFVTEFVESSTTIENYGNERKLTSIEVSIFERLLKGNFIYFSSLVFSREALGFLDGFEEDFVQAEDYELLLRLSHDFNGIQAGRVYYRLHQNNLSKSQTAEMYLENLEILTKYLKNRNAKVSFAYNLAKFAIFSLKTKRKHLFFKLLKSRKTCFIYLLLGFVMLFIYRIVRFIKVIGKKI